MDDYKLIIGGKRRRNNNNNQTTKDDVISGSDNNNNERSNKRKKGVVDYTKPVNFVTPHASNEEDDQLHRPSSSGTKIMEGGYDSRSGIDIMNTSGVGYGIGMRLLLKSGYKGHGGLGKNEQGIVAPIATKMRPKRMGFGYNEFKERPLVVEESYGKSSLPCRVEQGQSNEKLWSRRSLKQKNKNKNKKKEKVSFTGDELVAKSQQRKQVVEKIYDMRGPEVRVLTNLDNLNAEYEADGEWENYVPIAELEEKDESLQEEEADHLQQQDTDTDNMEDIMSVIEHIGDESSAGKLTLESLSQSFLDLQSRFSKDCALSCNLSCIACSYVLPLFIKRFQGWDPLQNPTYGMEVVSLWNDILLRGKDEFTFNLYMQLHMECLLPAVISGTKSWNARDPEPMVRFFESWEEHLLHPVMEIILDSIVLPKLSAAIESWEPCKETISIHSWVHPWLPLLGHKLESCYDTIRLGFASVLRAWHPSDVSVYYELSPWRNVFGSARWDQLMVRYIIPKLKMLVHDAKIDSLSDLDLDQFHWVRTWFADIPTRHMMQLMDIFFNKWEQFLYNLLCSNPPCFEEVLKWYKELKELLPPEFLANRDIRHRLSRFLEMMDQAVEGLVVAPPSLKENMSSNLGEFENQKISAQKRALDFNAVQVDDEVEISLKDIIEIHAQDNGLLLKPKPGRTQDGLQIYKFGNLSILIDCHNQKVFANTEEDKWSLVTLEQLLNLQNRPKGGSKRP